MTLMSDNQPLTLNRPCPICGKSESVQILDNRLVCNHDDCGFDEDFACPLCDASLAKADFLSDQHGRFTQCPSCRNKIHTLKIKNIIESGLIVDHEKRCGYCQVPTVYHPSMNLAHRCFYYPACSGQGDLFQTKKESFTFLDFETTGLEVGKDSIIEIGAVKIDEDGYEHPFQTFIKPPFPIPVPITKITGIDDSMVENAPDLKSAITNFVEFAGMSTIVAHNSDFDLPWLVTSCLRHDIDLNTSNVVCTFKWAKALGESRCSLGALSKKYGLSHNNAHRALADAAVTKELFFIFENSQSSRVEVPIQNYVEFSTKIVEKYKDFVQK